MYCLSDEITFVKYFTRCYKFPRTEFTRVPAWIYEEQPTAFSSLHKVSKRPSTGISWRHKKRGKTLETSEH